MPYLRIRVYNLILKNNEPNKDLYIVAHASKETPARLSIKGEISRVMLHVHIAFEQTAVLFDSKKLYHVTHDIFRSYEKFTHLQNSKHFSINETATNFITSTELIYVEPG